MDSPRPSIAAIIEWIFSKLSNKETLNSIMNNEEIDFFSLLAKGSYEQISLILDQIEQNEELLFTLRQIEFTVRYTSLKYNDDDNKIQPGIFERLNKLLLSNQDGSEPVAEITGTTLLDVMLMMTENNMKDIMSDEQIKNIQPSSINTKFFDFGNYKLIAYLKTNIEEFSTNLLNKLETDGASQTKIQLVKKILKFADEFNEGKLSDSELKIIENNQITLNKINPDTFKNSLNFDILFLALSTQNYRLAKELIEAGYKFYEDNEFGVNKISLITLGNIANEEKFLEIVKIAHEKEIFSLKQPISGTNDYPLDLIINNYLDPDSYFIDLAGGTLYKFKKPENVKIESINTDRISIAISHGNSFWSTGIFSATHFLQKQNPDIDFYLVTPQVIDQLGIDVFSTFDGWINPGAGDSYPKDKKEFSKADWKPEIDTEYIYQNVLGNATIYGLPTLGMCAGAQNLVLHHGGYIKPITGYSYGQHDITLQKNSPLSYLTLNHEEREEFHKIGHMPTIKFKGDTAHHFVAVNSKLPVGFSLGAVSEHNEAMGYCDASGIHCATQFHPENKANALNAQTNMMDRQIQLLNGFIELARMNHNCKNDNGICPTEFMANVNADLDLYYGICPLIGHEKALIEEMTC
jgi:anthranilate/para-aminobenzoate synthase component II